MDEKITFVVAGVAIVAFVAYCVYKNKSGTENTKRANSNKIRYQRDKDAIEKCIRDKDWDILEGMLNTTVTDFPDLVKKIKDALEKRA